MVGGPNPRTIHTMETVVGDTSIGHALAYCQTVEVPGGVQRAGRAPQRGGIALELERLANHTGTSAPLPATSVFCRPRRTAAGCAVTSSI